MTKVKLEIGFDEMMVLMFGMRKAVHYTRWFDPSFLEESEFEDKKKYMQTYHDMLFRLKSVLMAWNRDCPEEEIGDIAKAPFNYTFVEVDDEKATD